jgi:hypothetical protein
MEFVARKGGDVMDTNAMKFIPLNVHPWFIMNLYVIFSLISIIVNFQLSLNSHVVHFKLTFSSLLMKP